MMLMLASYVVRAERESGDKVTRAEPVAAQTEAGNLDNLEANWSAAFIEEAPSFPAFKFKDQVDALSGAFNRLIGTTVFATPEEFVRAPVARIPSTWARVAVLDIDQARIGSPGRRTILNLPRAPAGSSCWLKSAVYSSSAAV